MQMNAERLHVITLAIQQEMQSTNILVVMQLLRDTLQQMVSQPAHPQHQQNVSARRKEMRELLDNSRTRDFSPSWQQVVDEIGAGGLIGLPLRDRVESIFARNQITPSVAHEEISALCDELHQMAQAIDAAVKAFKLLRIGAEDLSPDEVEFGLVVPRLQVDNKLKQFGDELLKLNRALGPFSELVGEARSGYEIRTISSSDLSVYLHVLPQVGACLAVAIERIVSLYKQILEIRKLRRDLSDTGVPTEALAGVEEHVNGIMTDGIDALVAELMTKYGTKIDKGRRNELKADLRAALNQFANRIDRGFNIEIRVAPVEEEEQPAGTQESVVDNMRAISELSRKIEFLKPVGDPILRLKEPE